METNDGAGAGNGQAGKGAPAGGSPEGGSENDDKPITAKQLKAALENQRRHYEGKLDGQAREFEAFRAGAGQRCMGQASARGSQGRCHSRRDSSRYRPDAEGAHRLGSVRVQAAQARNPGAWFGSPYKDRRGVCLPQVDWRPGFRGNRTQGDQGGTGAVGQTRKVSQRKPGSRIRGAGRQRQRREAEGWSRQEPVRP